MGSAALPRAKDQSDDVVDTLAVFDFGEDGRAAISEDERGIPYFLAFVFFSFFFFFREGKMGESQKGGEKDGERRLVTSFVRRHAP